MTVIVAVPNPPDDEEYVLFFDTEVEGEDFIRTYNAMAGAQWARQVHQHRPFGVLWRLAKAQGVGL